MSHGSGSNPCGLNAHGAPAEPDDRHTRCDVCSSGNLRSSALPMARRYRRAPEGVRVPGPHGCMRGSRRRSGVWRESSAPGPVSGRCPAAGGHNREPQGAGASGTAPADRLVGAGRLLGGGDAWPRASRCRCRGVRGGTRRMGHVGGRAVLSGPRRPRGTAASEAQRQSLTARPACRGAHRPGGSALGPWREGGSPPAVMGARRSGGCPMASRRGPEQTTSGSGQAPASAQANRALRRAATRTCTTAPPGPGQSGTPSRCLRRCGPTGITARGAGWRSAARRPARAGRRLQRVVTRRVRRYWPQSSTSRGGG
jgi:hypothetical protein